MRRMSISTLRIPVVLAGLLAAGSVPAAEPDKPMMALAQLEPGLWEIRNVKNERARRRSICIGDATVLIQLEHRQINCSRLVITNGPTDLTVHYVCPYNGFGQTSLRVESPHQATLDTQGIVNNAPFAYRAELRRTGACGQARPAVR